MADNTYRSEALLAELRAAIPSNSVKDCEVCLLQNRIACVHLTDQQYASLKAGKRTLASEGDVYRTFECGHLYHALRRVTRTYGAPTVETEGMCGECWRYIASNGKRRRIDVVGKRRRPRDDQTDSKAKRARKAAGR
ncbi:hypothetical protein F5Y07DRAFT_162209 [Xylaria sp. FL0933]|nr:hypothetical protein F5Y07DRAFT_162209 [Xylaria sp. FL0933]